MRELPSTSICKPPDLCSHTIHATPHVLNPQALRPQHNHSSHVWAAAAAVSIYHAYLCTSAYVYDGGVALKTYRKTTQNVQDSIDTEYTTTYTTYTR